MQESQYSSTHSLTTALNKGERSTFRYDFQKADPDSVKCGTSTPAYSINISIAENIPLYVLIKFSPTTPPPIFRSLTTFQHNQLDTKSSLHVADMPSPFKKRSQTNTRSDMIRQPPLHSLTHTVHKLKVTNTIWIVGGLAVYVTVIPYYKKR